MTTRAALLGVALWCCIMQSLSTPACWNPLPSSAEYNKYIPDLTEVPLVMSVSLQPVIITDISPKEQTFTLIGYLFMGWTDRRLAFNATACNNGKNRYVLTGNDMSMIWKPQLEFPNAKTRTINPEEVNVWSNGAALYVGRIMLSLHADLDVSRFPFDEHDLTITVEEFDHPTPELVLVADDKAALSTFESSQFVFEDTITITRHLFPVPQRNTTWDQVTFSFHAKRIWASTFVNTIMPVLMIVAMGVCAFLLPRESSESRVSICITAFLSAIAFSVTLQSTLPPVRYITRMSLFIVLSYSATFLSLLGAVLVGVLHNQYKMAEAAQEPVFASGSKTQNPVHGIEMKTRGEAKPAEADQGSLLGAAKSPAKLQAKWFGGTKAERMKHVCNIVDRIFRYGLLPSYLLSSLLVFLV